MLVFLLLSALATTTTTAQDLRWVWGYNQNNILPSELIIPGRVEPATPSLDGPEAQPQRAINIEARKAKSPVTVLHSTVIEREPKSQTFHPSVQEIFQRSDKEIPTPKIEGETTKSRVFQDTLLPDSHVDHERYTTLDRLFKERGPYTPRERSIQTRNLGGLHPREVFYADDNLIIIKGGGFPSKLSEDALQNIEEETDEDLTFSGQGTILSEIDPNEEYNGNIAAIVAPPSREPSNFLKEDYSKSLLTHTQKRSSQFPSNPRGVQQTLRPVYKHQHVQPARLVYVQNSHQPVQPSFPTQPISHTIRNSPQPIYHPHLHQPIQPTHRIYPAQPQGVYPANTQPLIINHQQYPIRGNTNNQYPHNPPHISLLGDTDVNFLPPRPVVNPNAEVLGHFNEFQNQPKRFQLHQIKNANRPKPVL